MPQDKIDIITSFEKPMLYSANSLPSLAKEFRLFTLAPVYYYLQVPFDITMQFRAEVRNYKHVQIAMPIKVLDGVPPTYQNFLEGIEEAGASEFISYVRSLQIANSKTKAYAEIMYKELTLPPGILDSTVFKTYAVFLPNGNEMRYNLDTSTYPPKCVSEAISPMIVERANKLWSERQ